jgi:hypothetical protein
MAEQDDAKSLAKERERRYVAVEERVRGMFLGDALLQALAELSHCPRRSGLPALGAYYCECPACSPEDWGLGG